MLLQGPLSTIWIEGARLFSQKKMKGPKTGFKKRGPSPGTIFVKNRYQDICHAIPFSGSKFFVEFISGSKNTNRSLLNEISIFHTFPLYKSYPLLYRI